MSSENTLLYFNCPDWNEPQIYDFSLKIIRLPTFCEISRVAIFKNCVYMVR